MKPGTASFYRYFPVSHRDRNWGLYVTTAGEARVPCQATYPPNGHPKGFAFEWRKGRVLDGFALVYISSGGGNFESKSNISVSIESGHAFLLFPGVWHRYSANTETGWHEHWIGFDGEIARRWHRRKFISAKKPVVKIDAEDTVLATFNRMMQSIRTNRPALQQILAGGTGNLIGLIYSSQQGQPSVDAQNTSAIESAITCIQNEFVRDLNMKLLARDIGLSYSGFCHTFTEHTGLSPHRYLLELRLIRARSLLAETELSIKEISAQTGFKDELYFSRVFRRKLNLTPSKWRSQSRHRN